MAGKSGLKKEGRFLDYCALSQGEMRRLAAGTAEDRFKLTVPSSRVSSEEILRLQPVSFVGHAACLIFLALGVPNGVFTIPLLTFLIGRFVLDDVGVAFKALGLIMLPLVVLPQSFRPSSLQSWLAVQVLKYFSFRFIYDESPRDQRSSSSQGSARPQIFVAPPHGVFPYGNILVMLAWPSLTGHHFHGLAANSALRTPVFKQILKSIGVVDASRESARKALESYPYTGEFHMILTSSCAFLCSNSGLVAHVERFVSCCSWDITGWSC